MTVDVGPTALTVKFSGSDRFWAFSRGIALPWDRVQAAGVMDRATAEKASSWLRVGGSYIPRRLRAGRYGLGNRRQLWSVRRAQQVLAIDVRGRPSRVVLEVTDPEALASQISARLTG